MPTRNAKAAWEGTISKGKGTFEGETGAVKGAYSAGSRFAQEPGSNPEELLAAANAACFSMALSVALEKAGAFPTLIETSGACTVDKVGEGYQITTMKLRTDVQATGIDEAKFREVAESAKANCPVSKALQGNVEITLEATLRS
jgi:osmotically inducible protein OsmC